MINKNNLWFLTLFSLVLVLSIYYVTMPTDAFVTNNNAESANEEAKVNITETDVISALKLEDDNASNKEISEIKEKLSDSKTSVEEKNKAFEELKKVNGKVAKEEMIEEKIKTELKLDTFVKTDGDQIRVVVGSSEHSASLANEIMRLVQSLYDTKMYISVQFQN